MTQWVKVPGKPGDLSSIPRAHPHGEGELYFSHICAVACVPQPYWKGSGGQPGGQQAAFELGAEGNLGQGLNQGPGPDEEKESGRKQPAGG